MKIIITVLALSLAACSGSSVPAPPAPTAQHGLLLMGANDGQLFTVRDDGTGKVVLPGSGSMPSWTPDGRIILVSNRGSSSQIWIMDADGSNPRHEDHHHRSSTRARRLFRL